MGWRDLLQEEGEQVALPWIGGRSLRHGSRAWKIEGKLPAEHGWYRWNLQGRKATLVEAVEPGHGSAFASGYLLGDLFVSDQEGGEIKDPSELLGQFERVFLIDDGLDHFARVSVYRWWDDGPPIFAGEEFPAGPEDEVRETFLDRKESVADITGVPPALDLVFRMKTWHRTEVERRRAEEAARREQLRLEAEARRVVEERQRKVRETLGDGEIRRQLAVEDFEAAARAALAVGGGEYVEHRRSHVRGEFVVRYRVDGSRYECVCDQTMNIIDAGICLTDHDTGEKGDTFFTLESLPGVTRAAMAAGAAIWRHV